MRLHTGAGRPYGVTWDAVPDQPWLLKLPPLLLVVRNPSPCITARAGRRALVGSRPWAGRSTDIRIEFSAVYTLRSLFMARITSRDN